MCRTIQMLHLQNCTDWPNFAKLGWMRHLAICGAEFQVDTDSSREGKLKGYYYYKRGGKRVQRGDYNPD